MNVILKLTIVAMDTYSTVQTLEIFFSDYSKRTIRHPGSSVSLSFLGSVLLRR